MAFVLYITAVNKGNKDEFCSKEQEYIMRGDVWVSINKNGEKVLYIDNGKFVKQSVIKPKAKYKIKQPAKDYVIDGC